jgi:hypothetical protein
LLTFFVYVFRVLGGISALLRRRRRLLLLLGWWVLRVSSHLKDMRKDSSRFENNLYLAQRMTIND